VEVLPGHEVGREDPERRRDAEGHARRGREDIFPGLAQEFPRAFPFPVAEGADEDGVVVDAHEGQNVIKPVHQHGGEAVDSHLPVGQEQPDEQDVHAGVQLDEDSRQQALAPEDEVPARPAGIEPQRREHAPALQVEAHPDGGGGLGDEKAERAELERPGGNRDRRDPQHDEDIPHGLQQRKRLHVPQAVQIAQQNLVQREQHQPRGRVGRGRRDGVAVENETKQGRGREYDRGCHDSQRQRPRRGVDEETAALFGVPVVQGGMPKHRVVQAEDGDLRRDDVDRVGLVERPEGGGIPEGRNDEVDQDAAGREHDEAAHGPCDVGGELMLKKLHGPQRCRPIVSSSLIRAIVLLKSSPIVSRYHTRDW